MTTPAQNRPFGPAPGPRQAGVGGLRLVVSGDGPGEGEPAGAVEGEGASGAAQELYCELIRAAYAELQGRAEKGEERAQRWLERFLALGEQLGVCVTAAGAR